MSDKLAPDNDAAIASLIALRSTGPWNLSAIVPDGGIESATFSDAGEARAFIAARNGSRNLHFTPNPAAHPTGAGGRALKSDIDRIDYQFADLDLDKLNRLPPELAALPLAERKIKAAEAARNLPAGPPTFIIDSGGGIQVLWRRDDPVPATATSIEEAESINRRLLEILPGGDPGTHDVGRLLRIPGTINIPDVRKRSRGRVPVLAALTESTDRTAASFEFDRSETGTAATEVAVDIGAPDFVEDLDAFALRQNLPERLVTIIRDGRLPEAKKGDDSRSAWLFDAACGLVRARVPNETIAGILLDSKFGISESVLERADGDNDGDTRYAHHQIRRALGIVQAELADDFADDDIGELAAANTSSKPLRFGSLSILDILARPAPTWLVSDLIPTGGLIQIYGARKRGKTFAGLDLALRIATGRSYHGHAVQRGRVLYVAAEGGAERFGDRVIAWCRLNHVDPAETADWFRVVPLRLGIDNPKDRDEFIAANPGPFALTVFDTLARSMDGDENSTQDMNKTVKGADKVRDAMGGAVMLVHHTGHDESRQGRGSTALPGAVDCTLKVFRDKAGRVVVQLEESRDAEAGEKLHFEMVPIVVGDEPLRSSVALRFVENRPTAEPATAEDLVLIAIVEAEGVLSQAELVQPGVKGMSKGNVSKALTALRSKKLIEGIGPIDATKAGVERALDLGAAIPEDTTEG